MTAQCPSWVASCFCIMTRCTAAAYPGPFAWMCSQAEGDDSGDAGVGSPSELEYNHAAGSPPESAQDMRRVARLLVLPFVQHAADTAAATKIIESAAQNAAAAASEQAPQPTSALKKATSAGSQLRQAGSVKFATSPSRSASQPGLPSRPGTQPATSLASPISTSLLAVSPNLPAVELVGGRRSRQLTPSGSAAGTPLVGSRSAMLLPGAEQTAATLAEEPPPKVCIPDASLVACAAMHAVGVVLVRRLYAGSSLAYCAHSRLIAALPQLWDDPAAPALFVRLMGAVLVFFSSPLLKPIVHVHGPRRRLLLGPSIRPRRRPPVSTLTGQRWTRTSPPWSWRSCWSGTATLAWWPAWRR